MSKAIKNKLPAWFKSETNIQPVNGMMLIKQTNPNISIIELTGGKAKKIKVSDRPKYYIAGISIDKDEYYLGQQVLLHEGEITVGNAITIEGNTMDYNTLSDLYKDMEMNERQKLINSGVRVEVIQYFLIHNGSLQAIVD